MDIKIYSTPKCGYCNQAKRFLTERGMKYTEIDVSRDRAAGEKLIRLTGQTGVPVIVADGQVIIGFDQPRLEQLLSVKAGSNRPRFGLKVADASKIAQKAGAVPVFGALVGAVVPLSLGEKAGIKQGDIITEINMRPVRNADDLEKVITNMNRGSRASIVLMRGKETLRSEIIV